MKIKQILAITGAATALATLGGTAPARADGWFVPLPLQPAFPFYAPPVPIYTVVPQPFVVPQPVLVPQPVYVPQPVLIRPRRPARPVMADLVVVSYRIGWVRDANGVPRRMMTFVVRNDGPATAPPTVAAVTFDNGAPVYAPVPELSLCQTAEVMAETNGVISPGTLIKIIADCENRVPDLDRGNNQLVDRWQR